jgi:hypothetical protein
VSSFLPLSFGLARSTSNGLLVAASLESTLSL